MKKLLACLFLLTSVVGFSEEKISIENIEVRQEKLFIKGEETPITGTLEKKYPSGKIEATLEVVDGKLNGKTYIYYETGIVKKEENYVNSLMEGVVRTYYPSGRLLSQVNFKNDKEEGLMKGYFETGKLEIEIPYENGQVTGIEKKTMKKEKL
ncbi:hypothetical protein HMPREF9093_00328 [Fusobacterium sp. oral taxon 370 str. F0437]|nr:hypothetical protein HMPREF9093_00328 [Fusobacterium sp. oral taxon 370 str. F0437]